MTTSDPNKILKQIRPKPIKAAKFIKHNLSKERKYGIGKKKCRRCGRNRGHIGKYGLDLCRQCFREVAPKIGFKKFD
jgi:small subunit ribosomal protein S14